jgi:hypothetical protein
LITVKYAYSYDREDYTGSFDTPEAAFNAAVANCEGLSSPPTTIYIGTLVDPDPQATDHADRILEAMNRRAHVDYGSAAARYLRKVPPELVAELDEAIAQTILAWLRKHNLMPSFTCVRGIQEYPVRTPAGRRASASSHSEVREIGVGYYPGE